VHLQCARKLPYGGERGLTEQRVEHPEAVRMRPSQQGMHPRTRTCLDGIGIFAGDKLAQVAPSGGFARVHQRPHAVVAECEHGLCGAALAGGEQRDRRHAGKLAHETRHRGCVLLLVARHRHHHRTVRARTQLAEQLLRRIAMHAGEHPLAGRIDAMLLAGRDEREDGARLHRGGRAARHGCG